MPRGRKPKLTPEIQEAVVQAISIGATYEVAASFARLSRETVRRWVKRGDADGEGSYYAFAVAVREAEGKAAAQCLALIRAAAKSNWQAAAWLLERRHPDAYGRTKLDVKTEGRIEHQQAPAPAFDYSKYTEQELKDLERLLDKQEEEPPPAARDDAPGAEGGAGAAEPA